MIKKINIFMIMILVFISFLSCKKRTRNRRSRITKISVEVIKVKKENISKRLFLTGDIKGIEEVNVYSFVTGIIRNTYVKEGQRVFKGQALFSIDQTRSGADLRDYVVVSPISGIISNVSIDTGSQVIANQSIIANIVKTNQLKAEVYIPETEINLIKVGNKSIIKSSAAKGKIFHGKVFKISPVVNINNRMAKVEVLINEHGNLLKSGMFAEIEIFTNIQENKILVPLECVIYGDNLTYVFKLSQDKKRAIKHNVILGKNHSGMLVVENGLVPGDIVVSKGSYQVFDGFPVKVLNKKFNMNKGKKKVTTKIQKQNMDKKGSVRRKK